MSARAALAFVVVAGFTAGVASAAEPASAAFTPVSFLVGDWTGGGRAEGSAGTGGDSFAFELGGHVLVRRAHSSYPATADAPAGTYEGLMVIYPDANASGGLRADSYDSGGHVIRYALVPGSAPNVAQFLSDGPTAQPTFRLTYAAHAGGVLEVTFETARPGSATFAIVAHGIERRSP